MLRLALREDRKRSRINNGPRFQLALGNKLVTCIFLPFGKLTSDQMKVYVLPCSATTLVEDSQESRLSSFWIRPEVRSILLRPITRPLSDLSVNVPVQFMYVISFWFRRFRTIAADGASKDCPRCLSMDMHKSQISELGSGG